MPDYIAIEVKRDLEYVYKITGDLLNEIETAEAVEDEGNNNDLLGRVKQCLADTATVMQKDIYNCDFIISGTVIRDAQRQQKED